MESVYLKSAAMTFFKVIANIYCLRLSNEPLLIIVAQGVTKLLPVKVKGLKTNLAWVESMRKVIFPDLQL